MEQTFFIYGNQQFDIDETRDKIIASLISKDEIENSLVHFRVKEFFLNDRSKSAEYISELKNRCEMVSFFSSKTVIFLSDLQEIPQKKDPTEKIINKLKEINLVRKIDGNDSQWFDASTLSRQVETHHHITGFQLVQKLEQYGNNCFYLELIENWSNRIIYLQKGKGEEAIEITEFLRSRLKGEILFEIPANKESIQTTGSNIFVDLLKLYINNPPQDIFFVLTANIKKSSEINKELFKIINKKAKIFKKTVAYDDFRPINWVISKSEEKGLIIDRENADLLIEVAGADFSILDMELTKLSLLLPKNSAVTSELILGNISHSRNFSIFRISSFLIERDLKNSLECLEKLLTQKLAEGIAIFGVISAQFRRILRIQYLLKGGYPDKIVIGKLKLNPWIGQKLLKSSNKFSVAEIENIIILLAENDVRLKYNAIEADIILRNICYQICSRSLAEQKFLEKEWV